MTTSAESQSSPVDQPRIPIADSECVTLANEKSFMIQKVKQEVKRLMEEAVTRKFIHEDSSSVRSLCAVVDQCITHKLKKSAMNPLSLGGFWSASQTTSGKPQPSASLNLVSKLNKQLANENGMKQQLSDILCQVQDKESAYKIMMRNSSGNMNAVNSATSVVQLQEFPSDRALRFLWMRLALFAGILDKVVELICKESSKFYEKDAFMCDPVVTTLLISLLVGPCSLDYSKAKTPDHLWTDPHAEELLLKHKIHSNIGYTPALFNGGRNGDPDGKRALVTSNRLPNKTTNFSATDLVGENAMNGNGGILGGLTNQQGGDGGSPPGAILPVGVSHSPKDYVDSLHQNNKETLIYGKNNVTIQPSSDLEPMLGYLSLHQSTCSPTSLAARRAVGLGKQPSWLQLQWTPNDVMSSDNNNSVSPPGVAKEENKENNSSSNPALDRDTLWKYAMSVDLRDILYLHCHQTSATKDGKGVDGISDKSTSEERDDTSEIGSLSEGDTLVMVGHDGVSLAPITFPPSSQPGGHLLSFLSCLENALMPQAQLQPPLWLHRSKGKVFPRLFESKEILSSVGSETSNHCESPSMSLAKEKEAGQPQPQKSSIEKYILSVSLSNPIGELVSSSKLFESMASSSQEMPKSNSDSDKLASKHEDEKERRFVQSRDFVFRIVHLHAPAHAWSPDGSSSSQSATPTPPPNSNPASAFSFMSHFNFSQTAILGQKNLLREAANMTVEKQERSKLHHQSEGVFAETEVANHRSEEIKGQEAGDGKVEISEENNSKVMMGHADQENIQKLCCSMRRQILARAFYGWLTYVRHLKTVRTHLSCLVYVPHKASSSSETAVSHNAEGESTRVSEDVSMYLKGLLPQVWNEWKQNNMLGSKRVEILKYVYHGGVDHSLRKEVWLHLLGHYPLDNVGGTVANREEIDRQCRENYERILAEWTNAEKYFLSSKSIALANSRRVSEASCTREDFLGDIKEELEENESPSLAGDGNSNSSRHCPTTDEEDLGSNTRGSANVSFDIPSISSPTRDPDSEQGQLDPTPSVAPLDPEVIGTLGLNLHRIDKDVARCDRNNIYFMDKHNLDKLRRIMCSYVWENMDLGYVQGMCDIVAPLLVIFDEEDKTFAAFSLLMVRMRENFPQGRAMDQHFSNMRALLQILDPQLFEHMQQHGDYTHFYFCYRWFLLDFKRELKYPQVFWLWETIWAASKLADNHCMGTHHFVLFVALALLKMYRKIIINYKMDFTDIIKFFNEMAECHKVEDVLLIARELLLQLNLMLENK